MAFRFANLSDRRGRICLQWRRVLVQEKGMLWRKILNRADGDERNAHHKKSS